VGGVDVDEEQEQAWRTHLTTLLLALDLLQLAAPLSPRQMVLLGHVARSAHALMRAMLALSSQRDADDE
jgi:hypothetical protein